MSAVYYEMSHYPHQVVGFVAGFAKPIIGTDIRDRFVNNIGVELKHSLPCAESVSMFTSSEPVH